MQAVDLEVVTELDCPRVPVDSRVALGPQGEPTQAHTRADKAWHALPPYEWIAILKWRQRRVDGPDLCLAGRKL